MTKFNALRSVAELWCKYAFVQNDRTAYMEYQYDFRGIEPIQDCNFTKKFREQHNPDILDEVVITRRKLED